MTPSARILVVEDEAIVARDLELGLHAIGYSPIAIAASGEDAIRIARLLKPDLVLMDVRLEGKVDGIQAAAAIKTDLDIPIVFVTAHSDDETLKRATATDPYGYVVKPFRAPELRCVIEIALKRHETEMTLRDLAARRTARATPPEIPIEPPQVLTVRDVAQYLSVDERTIYRAAKRGRIPAFKVAGSWRFRRADIEAWIAQQTAGRTPPDRMRDGAEATDESKVGHGN